MMLLRKLRPKCEQHEGVTECDKKYDLNSRERI